MESIFKNYYYNFKMLFYSSTLSSDKSRNSILFFRKDFVIQKVIVSEFNFGRHGRTVLWLEIKLLISCKYSSSNFYFILFFKGKNWWLSNFPRHWLFFSCSLLFFVWSSEARNWVNFSRHLFHRWSRIERILLHLNWSSICFGFLWIFWGGIWVRVAGEFYFKEWWISNSWSSKSGKFY